MLGDTTSIIILGATGDLARRKLVPALFQLACKGRLPANIRIVGVSRSSYTDDQFQKFMWDGMREFGELAAKKEEWSMFTAMLHYIGGDLEEASLYTSIDQRLTELEGDTQPANRLYYLSTSPALYETILTNLSASGLAREDTGWRRVVMEKPFGWDLKSAKALNNLVHQTFSERQVFRIDHYLGKETVQNLLVFRFANTIFEPVWNRNYVDNVQITVAESVGVGERGEYYDQFGVVRDMVQNHLLQLLTLVAMEPPSAMDADSLRNSKVDVLKAIKTWTPEEAAQHAVRGQYSGYADEAGVPPQSKTATYAALRLYVNNWRWNGVPFYLRSGKAMEKKASEVVIQFQCPPHVMFALGPEQSINPNILSLCLQPDEGVHLRFEVKLPDEELGMHAEDMEFHYTSVFKDQEIPEAYERLLQDALEGDAALFIRNDHIEEAWRIVDPLLELWEEPGAPPLRMYEPGTWGPEAAGHLLAENGHEWQHVCGEHS
jgi:glucose-6-phosphate 1-dehydrogenase